MIEIADISQRPEAIDPLSSWNYGYWADRTPEVRFDQWRQLYRECANTQGLQIPLTIVGLEDGAVFGGVTIVEVDDIHDFPDYFPWIAALVVGETFRGRGLGSILLDAAIAKARQLGFHHVFLWTDSRNEWYGRHGWVEIHRLPLDTIEAVVMKLNI